MPIKEFKNVVMFEIMDKKFGIKIVRQIILEDKLLSIYRFAREMGVAEGSVRGWLEGRFFNEGKHLPKLIEVRDKWMRLKGRGIYNKGE